MVEKRVKAENENFWMENHQIDFTVAFTRSTE
jgi:hypothetical protein